jgi:hypothetical protein
MIFECFVSGELRRRPTLRQKQRQGQNRREVLRLQTSLRMTAKAGAKARATANATAKRPSLDEKTWQDEHKERFFAQSHRDEEPYFGPALGPLACGGQARWRRAGGGVGVKGGFVYILASKSGVLYTGVTSSLDSRIVQHRLKLVEGFTKKYNVSRLVHYERFADNRAANTSSPLPKPS